MLPRMLTATLLLVVLALTSGPAAAFPWPSRWTNKSKQPETPSPTTPAPGTPPVVSWPPKASEIRPDPVLPKLPSNTGFAPLTSTQTPKTNVTPVAPAPSRSSLVNAVELGRPQALATPPADPVATLPAVLPTPQVTTNPTNGTPLPPVPQPYLPPGASRPPEAELVQQVGFDQPRRVVRAQVEEQEILPVQLEGPPPVSPPPMGGAITNPLPPLPEGRYNAGVEMGQPIGRPPSSVGGFWGSSTTATTGSWDGWFCESDHAFRGGIISPVTSPSTFEDPRALTELRPVFIYGLIPGSSDLTGGKVGYIGVQGRLAFSQSWSLVINKLGWVSINPDDPNPFNVDGGSGFAEFNIGPKWTFWRSESLNMVAAAGLTFQLPIGSSSVYQNTGTLGLDPYLSYGWNFGRSDYGSFNFLTSVGYNFSIDDARSQFFHNHYHLSYDVGNLQHFYPLIELNWYKYTKRGHDTPYTWEGKDLVNFGASNQGFHSQLSLAVGARFKYNEHIQAGLAAEWDLINKQSSLEDFRMTFDLIFRY